MHRRALLFLAFVTHTTMVAASFSTAAPPKVRQRSSKQVQECHGGMDDSQHRTGLTMLAMLLTGSRYMKALALALPRPFVWAWRRLPARLPSWWRARGLTKDALGQIAFMASNAAYFGAGMLLLASDATRSFGVMMLGVCVASCAYHLAQCLHGCESAQRERGTTVLCCVLNTACVRAWMVAALRQLPVPAPSTASSLLQPHASSRRRSTLTLPMSLSRCCHSPSSRILSISATQRVTACGTFQPPRRRSFRGRVPSQHKRTRTPNEPSRATMNMHTCYMLHATCSFPTSDVPEARVWVCGVVWGIGVSCPHLLNSGSPNAAA